jgi:acetate kinase
MMRVLVVNAGSSSLKLALLDADDTLLGRAEIEGWAGSDVREPLRAFITEHGPADVVAHRVVHGGAQFVGPVVVDQAVERALEALGALAPLHQQRGLDGVRSAATVLPGAVQVACFDTAFHAAMPSEAATYPLPPEWRQRWPIRRYGFHGLSHAYALRRAARLVAGDAESLRVVSCHLGSGASLCAARGGRSLDTTMGFTPLDGLVMASRPGAIDPGLVLWLIGNTDGGLDEVNRGLEERSGLVGLAGGSGDMRDIVTRRRRGDANAILAFDVYLHRLAREIAAMTAAIGGLDVLVFTGGVGEHSSEVRTEVARRLDFLGVRIDSASNEAIGPVDRDISPPSAAVRALVVESREDLEIARQTRSLLYG